MLKTVAIDTETTGVSLLRGDRAFVITACDDRGETNFWRWKVDYNTGIPEKTPKSIVKEVEEFTANRDVVKVFHNAKFDLRALKLAGIKVAGQIEDTMLAAHILNSSEKHGLKELAFKYLGIMEDDEIELQYEIKNLKPIAKANGWAVTNEKTKCYYWLSESDALKEYAVTDVIRTRLLWEMLSKQLGKNPTWKKLYENEKRLMFIVSEMEETGVRIHPDFIKKELSIHSKIVEHTKEKLRAITKNKDLNPNSTMQMGKYIFSELPVVKLGKKSGNPSLDKEVIKELLELYPYNKLLNLLNNYRKSEKAIEYLEKYLTLAVKDKSEGLILYTNFNQTGTSTTRFSSSIPNLQNVGKAEKDPTNPNLRTVFSPRKGKVWIAADYSQLEIRLFAFIAKEETMIKWLEEGKDIHTETANLIFGKTKDEAKFRLNRRLAKDINFMKIYGGGLAKAEKMTGSREKAETLLNAYNKNFPMVKKFMDNTIRRVRKVGFVETAYGYPLQVDKHAAYAGVNYIIQGTAGNLLKNSMIKCHEVCKKFNANMVLTIHDELVFEIDCTKKLREFVLEIKKNMEDNEIDGLTTPVDIGLIENNWGSKIEYHV